MIVREASGVFASEPAIEKKWHSPPAKMMGDCVIANSQAGEVVVDVTMESSRMSKKMFTKTIRDVDEKMMVAPPPPRMIGDSRLAISGDCQAWRPGWCQSVRDDGMSD